MDFLVPESRRSLTKSLARVFETELEPCDALIEDEGNKSFEGLEAIRCCGLFGVETLTAAGSCGARFARFEPARRFGILDAAVRTH
jgi:hypothetical protein